MPARSDNAVKNLISLSSSQNFTYAMSEWVSTGTVIHSDNNLSCHLCENESLHTQFEIENVITGHKLLVGSSCILKFTHTNAAVLSRHLANHATDQDSARHATLYAAQKAAVTRRFAIVDAVVAAGRKTCLGKLRALYKKAAQHRSLIAQVEKAVKSGGNLDPQTIESTIKLLVKFGLCRNGDDTAKCLKLHGKNDASYWAYRRGIVE